MLPYYLSLFHNTIILASARENLSLVSGVACNKDAVQPVHLRSLIRTFVFRKFVSIISRLAMSISIIF